MSRHAHSFNWKRGKEKENKKWKISSSFNLQVPHGAQEKATTVEITQAEIEPLLSQQYYLTRTPHPLTGSLIETQMKCKSTLRVPVGQK